MNPQGDSSYQYVYYVALLDDLHNYFPALLYEMDRFQTIPHVFQYVRQRINSRFNLYNYGASLAAAQNGYTGVQNPGHRFANPPYNPAYAAPPANRDLDLFTLAAILAQAPSQIWTLGGAGNAGIPQNLQPVIVRPSAEVIAQSTEIVAGNTLSEGTICPICQDNIITTDTARKIRSCNHVYHQGCIDQWFERSVLCPTCRRDVRVP
jgi:hypothetical protein